MATSVQTFLKFDSILLVISATVSLSGCDNKHTEMTGKDVEITYPVEGLGTGQNRRQIKLNLDAAYLVDETLTGDRGPPVVALNYKDMKPSTSVPQVNSNIVLASAMLPLPKFPDNRSDFMEQPFVENFSWFKDGGHEEYGLAHRTYKVVDVAKYPMSSLYLKNQVYHDFFIFCGVDESENKNICILGKEIEVRELNSDRTHIVNLNVRMNRRALIDWRDVEKEMTKFFLDRLEIIIESGGDHG